MASTKGSEDEGRHDPVVKTASVIVSSFRGQQQAMMNELKSFDSRFAGLEIPKGESRNAPRLEHTLSTAETSLKAFIQSTDSEESSHSWDRSRASVDCFLSAFASIMSVVADSQATNSDSECMNRAISLLRQCLSKLDKELAYWLAHDGVPLGADQLASLADDYENAPMQLQLMPQEAVDRLAEIVQWTISGGGGKECCVTYAAHRQKALEQNLAELGLPPTRTDAELSELSWANLVGDTGNCSQYIRAAVHAVLYSERTLCDSVFPKHAQLADTCFFKLAVGAMGIVFGLTGEVTSLRRSDHPDQVVRVLELYEPLQELEPPILSIFHGPVCEPIRSQYEAMLVNMRDKLLDFMADLELSAEKDVDPLPTAIGAVLPFTSYLANLFLALHRQERTLSLLLNRQRKPSPVPKLLEEPAEEGWGREGGRGGGGNVEGEEELGWDSQGSSGGMLIEPVFGTVIRWNFHMLQKHLEERSKEFEQPAQRKLFLMNNLHYLANKVKRSNLRDLLGDDWLMELGLTVRELANEYQRVTWKPFLECLKDEGGGWGGHISPINIKKRFRECNSRFFEIHATQKLWHVPDRALRQEVRSAMVARVDIIYRAFYFRYKPIVEVVWNLDKYVKLHPDLVASKIEEFFQVSEGK